MLFLEVMIICFSVLFMISVVVLKEDVVYESSLGCLKRLLMMFKCLIVDI